MEGAYRLGVKRKAAKTVPPNGVLPAKAIEKNDPRVRATARAYRLTKAGDVPIARRTAPRNAPVPTAVHPKEAEDPTDRPTAVTGPARLAKVAVHDQKEAPPRGKKGPEATEGDLPNAKAWIGVHGPNAHTTRIEDRVKTAATAGTSGMSDR